MPAPTLTLVPGEERIQLFISAEFPANNDSNGGVGLQSEWYVLLDGVVEHYSSSDLPLASPAAVWEWNYGDASTSFDLLSHTFQVGQSYSAGDDLLTNIATGAALGLTPGDVQFSDVSDSPQKSVVAIRMDDLNGHPGGASRRLYRDGVLIFDTYDSQMGDTNVDGRSGWTFYDFLSPGTYTYTETVWSYDSGNESAHSAPCVVTVAGGGGGGGGSGGGGLRYF